MTENFRRPNRHNVKEHKKQIVNDILIDYNASIGAGLMQREITNCH